MFFLLNYKMRMLIYFHFEMERYFKVDKIPSNIKKKRIFNM